MSGGLYTVCYGKGESTTGQTERWLPSPGSGTEEAGNQRQWNGEYPVDTQGSELCAYSTHMSCLDQDEGFCAARHRSPVSSSWFILSVCPDKRLALAPTKLQNSFQNREGKWGPRSETMSLGNPYRRMTWDKINSAVSLAEGSLGRATKWVIFENRSMIVSIGWSWPAGAWWEGLHWAQVGQADTYSLISFSMLGHQKRCLTLYKVRLIPGWQAREEVWHQWITSERSTNRRLSGAAIRNLQVLLGTNHSLLHLPGDCPHHKIITEDWNRSLGRRVRINNTRRGIWLDIFRTWATIKLNRLKKRFHLACLGFSHLAERRYSKFLWSVQTRKGSSAPSNKCLHSSRAILMASSSRSPTLLFLSALDSFLDRLVTSIKWYRTTWNTSLCMETPRKCMINTCKPSLNALKTLVSRSTLIKDNLTKQTLTLLFLGHSKLTTFITTDASDYGLGAVLHSCTQTM